MQQRQATEVIASLQREFEDRIETRVLPFRDFKPSDERFINYYATNPDKPFCRRYIEPKLDVIRRKFAEILVPNTAHPKPIDTDEPDLPRATFGRDGGGASWLTQDSQRQDQKGSQRQQAAGHATSMTTQSESHGVQY